MGYIHGSNLLAGEYADNSFTPFGYSKSCSVNYSAETKERMHKQQDNSNKKFADKTVNKISCTVQTEGFVMAESDTDLGYKQLRAKMLAGEPVTLRWGERASSGIITPMEGSFLITSLDLNAPADDDATYTASFENSGPVAPVA